MKIKYLLCHERNMNRFFVERGRHLSGLANIPTVHQPEPGADLEKEILQRISDEGPEETDRGGEVNTVVDEGERSAASDVLPLSSRGAAYNDDKMIGGSGLDWEGSCSHSYHLLSVKVSRFSVVISRVSPSQCRVSPR